MSQETATRRISGRSKSYTLFFDSYLSEHSQRATRRMHYIGSTLGLMALAVALIEQQPLWILAGFVAGYGCAWMAHVFIEKNHPTTFKNPVWSFIADYHMYYLWLTDRLEPRRQRALLHRRLSR
jgi:hypothetical protein